MTNPTSTQESLVVGYFADGANAYSAINELIDEGFHASEIGAAFRAPRAASSPGAAAQEQSASEMKGVRELTERNPAVSGTVGGPASRDQAVQPAGLAPGSGNAFPAPPSTPGPIPGSEIPSTLKHDLPETLPHELPSTLRPRSEADAPWLEQLHRNWSSSTAQTAKNRNSAATGNQKFGTGEATLGLEQTWSEPAFESSFTGMGLSPEQARGLSGELGRGGAVITINAGARSSLAEAIVERNHGRVRLEYSAGTTTLRPSDRESPVQIYGSMGNYYRTDTEQKKKAS
ncbi:MAG TPA: hypothetical protein VHE33_05510 [Acidobacteriaceae bacterium]|nr:hypothetical protein [Acidobacteriaceae bacterium]